MKEEKYEILDTYNYDVSTKIVMYGKNENDNLFYKICIEDKNTTILESFQLSKNDLLNFSSLASRKQFYKNVKIIYFGYLKSMKKIILVIDKLGFIDVHNYNVSNDKSIHKDKIIPLKNYKILPMDVDFKKEDFQDAKIYNNKLFILSKSTRGSYGVCFFDTYDIVSNEIKSFKVELSKKGDENENFSKNNNIEDNFYLEDSFSKKSNLGYKFYITNIESKSMIIINDRTENKFFQTDLKYEKPKFEITRDLNTIIKYKL